MSAIREIPKEMLNDFTLNGKIKIFNYFIDESKVSRRIYDKNTVKELIEKSKSKDEFYYQHTDKWLYDALEKYPINEMEIAIMGSQTPTYESICIVHGGKPTTIDYGNITSEDDRIKIMSINEYNSVEEFFDGAFSISSFEHDGLGRYGDPINPFADIEAMKKLKKSVKKGGILFFAVPIGSDAITWNAHRIYGEIRLPLLLDGWEIIDSYGYNNDSLKKETNGNCGIQPLFVLKNIE